MAEVLEKLNVDVLGKFVRIADATNDWIGRTVAWLTLVIVLITFAVVVLRYGFSIGWVAMQESYVWLHGVIFMIGAGYTLLHGGHVRVDVIYRGASPRYKAIVDILGVLFLLLPIVVLIWVVGLPYVAESWGRLEESREAGGLKGLFLLKTVILVFCGVMLLQGLSLLARSLLVLAGRDEFIVTETSEDTV